MDATIEIRPFAADDAEAVKIATELYIQTWGGAWERPIIHNFIARYNQKEDWRGFFAYAGEQAIGSAFGTRSLISDWWHAAIAEQIGAEHPALQDAWVLVELDVLAEYRNRQIGGRLHDHILAAVDYPNLLLSTQVSNEGAQRFYQRRGWSVLHTGFVFREGQDPFMVFHRPHLLP